jgi:hypothetical protein
MSSELALEFVDWGAADLDAVEKDAIARSPSKSKRKFSYSSSSLSPSSSSSSQSSSLSSANDLKNALKASAARRISMSAFPRPVAAPVTAPKAKKRMLPKSKAQQSQTKKKKKPNPGSQPVRSQSTPAPAQPPPSYAMATASSSTSTSGSSSSNSSSSAAPRTEVRAAPTPTTALITKVSMALTGAQLKAECKARGGGKKGFKTSGTKAEMVNRLVAGSDMQTHYPEYTAMLEAEGIVKTSKAALLSAQSNHRAAVEAFELRKTRDAREEQSQARQLQEEQARVRKAQINSVHTIDVPFHLHKVALTVQVLQHLEPNSYQRNRQCDRCETQDLMYTCFQCDHDWCAVCVEFDKVQFSLHTHLFRHHPEHMVRPGACDPAPVSTDPSDPPPLTPESATCIECTESVSRADIKYSCFLHQVNWCNACVPVIQQKARERAAEARRQEQKRALEAAAWQKREREAQEAKRRKDRDDRCNKEARLQADKQRREHMQKNLKKYVVYWKSKNRWTNEDSVDYKFYSTTDSLEEANGLLGPCMADMNTYGSSLDGLYGSDEIPFEMNAKTGCMSLNFEDLGGECQVDTVTVGPKEAWQFIELKLKGLI